jgi:hypothetical protein
MAQVPVACLGGILALWSQAFVQCVSSSGLHLDLRHRGDGRYPAHHLYPSALGPGTSLRRIHHHEFRPAASRDHDDRPRRCGRVPAGGSVHENRSTDSEAARGRGNWRRTRNRSVNSCASARPSSIYAIAACDGQVQTMLPVVNRLSWPNFSAVWYQTKACRPYRLWKPPADFPRNRQSNQIRFGHDWQPPKDADFAFFLTDPSQLSEPERRFTLSADDIALIKPNTKTAPVFHSRADAQLTAKIHANVPVLIVNESRVVRDRWNVRLRTMFHQSNASKAGDLTSSMEIKSSDLEASGCLPVHEGDYGHQFDHRFATFDGRKTRLVMTSRASRSKL